MKSIKNKKVMQSSFVLTNITKRFNWNNRRRYSSLQPSHEDNEKLKLNLIQKSISSLQDVMRIFLFKDNKSKIVLV